MTRAGASRVSTELAVVTGREAIESDGSGGDVLAQVEQARAALPSLIEAGDTETIKRWRDEGQVAALAAKKLGYERESVETARSSTKRCTR
jgi:hypothetical protein